MIFLQNNEEDGPSWVQYRPLTRSQALLTGERASYPEIANTPFSIHLRGNDSLDMPVEGLLGPPRFEHKRKLDQLVVAMEPLLSVIFFKPLPI